MMVCRIIKVDGVAPRGTEAAMGYKELVIVTIKYTCKKNTNRRYPSKTNPFKGSHVIKNKIGKQ